MMNPKHLILTILALVLASLLYAQAPPPLTQKEVIDLLKQAKKKKDFSPVIKVLGERGVDFDLDPEHKIEQKLRKAGADDALLQGIWKAGPTYRASLKAMLTPPVGPPLEASPEESETYLQLQAERDPERQLKMLSDFEARFPNSQLLSYAYTQVAKAFQQRGDLEKVVEFCDKSLKLDSHNLLSLVMIAITTAQPKMLQGTPAENERKLSLAEAYAERSLQMLDQMQKPEDETQEQFQQRKAAIAADVHFARGMVHLLRNEHDSAVAQFEKAISLTTTPNPLLYFRLGEAQETRGKFAEATKAFTQAAELAAGTVIERLSRQRLRELELKK